jgi:hypothetical protein
MLIGNTTVLHWMRPDPYAGQRKHSRFLHGNIHDGAKFLYINVMV